MPIRCAPPKSVRVKSYSRKSRRRKPKKRKAPARYWTCVRISSGRACGVHHRTLSGAVAHRKKLDQAARNYSARHGGAVSRWHVERKGA